MSRLGGWLVRGGLGIAISVAAVVFVLRGVDLGQAVVIVGRTAPSWLGLAAAALALDVLLRARRWQVLVAPIHAVRYARLLGYLLVGYLANNVLPARLGELVRSHYLGDREGISRSATLGTVVVERVIDTVVLVVLAAAAIIALSVRGIVVGAVGVGLAISMLLVVALAIAIAADRLPGADRVARVASRWPRIRDIVAKLREGLAVATRPGTVVHAVALSGVAWAATVIAFAAAGQAVGIELTMGQAAILAAGVNLATAIPSGPGYVGTFELATVEIGAAVGIDRETAFALGIVVHVATIALTSTGGALSLVRLGWRRPEPAPVR